MIKFHKLRLLEDNELRSFLVNYSLVTESELQSLIFQALKPFVGTTLPFLLYNIGLQISEHLKALLCTLNHQISRLLQRHVVLTLLMFDIVLLMGFLEFVLECLFPVFCRRQNTVPLQESLFEILALQFL